MGIFGLETYLLEYHARACPRVVVKDLVAEYRKETGRDDAVAVVDANILIRQCVEDLDVVCGGQFLEYRTNLLKYVQRLKDIGISPVFFFDGAVDSGKMECWMSRKDETLRRIDVIYRSVDAGHNRCPIPVESSVLPAGIYECTILTLKEAGYPVFCAISESDIEIARYARLHGCFGIMSRDTDFVILEGAKYYLSLFYKHVKFHGDVMSTYLFDREAIARSFQLHPVHLPLLASLLDNDYVDSSYLTPLYSKLLGRRGADLDPAERYRLEDLVPCLVRLIRDDLSREADAVEAILRRTLDGWPPFKIKKLAQRLGHKDHFEMRDRLRSQLEVSLRLHEFSPLPPPSRLPSPEPELECSDVDQDVLELARHRHRNTLFLNSAVLSLLTRRSMEIGPALEDPDPRLSCASTCTGLRPFRSRVYGLLQQVGPYSERIVPSQLPGPGLKYEPVIVDPVPVDPKVLPHPGLLALWGEDQEDVLHDKWRLFSWALAAHRPPSARVDALAATLKSLPMHLVVPVALVYVLFNSGVLAECERSGGWSSYRELSWRRSEEQLEEQERPERRSAVELARLLVRTCLMAPLCSEQQLRALRLRRYNRFEVHVAALFMRTFTYVSMLNDIVGAPVPLEKLHPALYFNGKLFHYVFTGMDLAGLGVEVDDSLEKLIMAAVCEERVDEITEE